MPTTFAVAGGTITVGNMEIKCPCCGHKSDADKYAGRLERSKRGYIYVSCDQCNARLGLSVDFMGDIVCWAKNQKQ
jgi:DNA-directed RNA polymerase subunit RPC12/RpoP